MKRIIITGATGFIGKDFLSRFDDNSCELTLLTRDPEKLKGLTLQVPFTIVKGDLQDRASLVSGLKNHDILINLAAEVRNQSELQKTNVEGTKNLLYAVAENKIQKIIHLSSVGVVGAGYETRQKIIDESTSAKPTNLYEKTKFESEQLIQQFSRENNIGLVILRPTNVFGEGHPFDALLRLMKKIQEGKRIPLSARAIANFVYVGDVSESINFFIENHLITGVFNIGSPVKMEDFVKSIANQLKNKPKVFFIPFFFINLFNKMGVRIIQPITNAVAFSDAKLKQCFDYPIGWEEGVSKTIKHFKLMGKL